MDKHLYSSPGNFLRPFHCIDKLNQKYHLKDHQILQPHFSTEVHCSSIGDT